MKGVAGAESAMHQCDVVLRVVCLSAAASWCRLQAVSSRASSQGRLHVNLRGRLLPTSTSVTHRRIQPVVLGRVKTPISKG